MVSASSQNRDRSKLSQSIKNLAQLIIPAKLELSFVSKQEAQDTGLIRWDHKEQMVKFRLQADSSNESRI